MSSTASNDSIIYHCHFGSQGEEGLNQSQVSPGWQETELTVQNSGSLVLHVHAAKLRQEYGT